MMKLLGGLLSPGRLPPLTSPRGYDKTEAVDFVPDPVVEV